MKTLVSALAMLCCMTQCLAGSRNVPDKVQRLFAQQYPQAHLRKWETRNDTCIAEFSRDRRKNRADYSAQGEWLKTETKIPWTKDLPPAVASAWRYSDFASWYVAAIREVTFPGSTSRYVVSVEQDYGPESSIPGD